MHLICNMLMILSITDSVMLGQKDRPFSNKEHIAGIKVIEDKFSMYLVVWDSSVSEVLALCGLETGAAIVVWYAE